MMTILEPSLTGQTERNHDNDVIERISPQVKQQVQNQQQQQQHIFHYDNKNKSNKNIHRSRRRETRVTTRDGWDRHHQETCWKRCTIAATMNNVFDVYYSDKKNNDDDDDDDTSEIEELILDECALPYRNDVILWNSNSSIKNNKFSGGTTPSFSTPLTKTKFNNNDSTGITQKQKTWSQQTNDDDDFDYEKYEFNDENFNRVVSKIVEQYQQYVLKKKMKIKQQQQQQFTSPIRNMKNNTETTSASSSLYRFTSSLVSTGYQYVVMKPVNTILESLIGTSDYDATAITIQDSDSQDPKTYPVSPNICKQIYSSVEGIPMDNSMYRSINSINKKTNEFVISQTDSIICMDLVFQALECIENWIRCTKPTILSLTKKESKSYSHHRYTVVLDWIRTNSINNYNTTKDNYDTTNSTIPSSSTIEQFISDLNDRDLFLLISCLQSLSTNSMKQNGTEPFNECFIFYQYHRDSNNNTIVYLDENQNDENENDDLWIIGYDPIASIDVRITLYDLNRAHEKITSNINIWQEQMDQCTIQARHYKVMIEKRKRENQNTVQQQNYNIKQEQYFRAAVGKVLQRRKLYSTKIETANNLLLQVEQQQISLESALYDVSALQVLEQTAQSLRKIRIMHQEHQEVIQQQLEHNDDQETMLQPQQLYQQESLYDDEISEQELDNNIVVFGDDCNGNETSNDDINIDDDFNLEDYVDVDSIDEETSLYEQLQKLSITPNKKKLDDDDRFTKGVVLRTNQTIPSTVSSTITTTGSSATSSTVTQSVAGMRKTNEVGIQRTPQLLAS